MPASWRVLIAMLSVQILCAKQGLRVRRQLTRANVKEKVKEIKRVLAKLRFMAKEVQLLPGYPVSVQLEVQTRRCYWAGCWGSC